MKSLLLQNLPYFCTNYSLSHFIKNKPLIPEEFECSLDICLISFDDELVLKCAKVQFSSS